MFLGIEIGGTKLQLGLGRGDGVLVALWRGAVNPAAGSDGIRAQIVGAVPELLARAGIERAELRGAGIGFGGPTDDATQTVIKSHQIEGWDGFPLADWVGDLLDGVPVALCNDADVAGLAEALFGAGQGLSPIFYITVGTGVGGGLIVDGKIYRGVGKGAAEIGHLCLFIGHIGREPLIEYDWQPIESVASGRGIEWLARTSASGDPQRASQLIQLAGGNPDQIKVETIAAAIRRGDEFARDLLGMPLFHLAGAICQVIALLCPARIVIGGGVSLLGEELFFAPLRRLVEERVFAPFRGLTDIVPAALGEEVVVHGALALARQKFSH
jgi:glucokinase